MLQLKEISKVYKTGDTIQTALDKVSINFRESEFVSILGQSGSGKTTLLNIIGGLDQYTSGDLIIKGRSTKDYRDSDWDTYRNHSIGFVFQSYNLIPHQSVLANVELALTISGVSKTERRKRAVAALERVGLVNQLHKRPNQMSGGQMQRVAIARALVNNPDILLADEPTGALDSETSVQVLDILKEISRDRLVIMVTHNPELAERYSTRTVRLLDGRIISDTDPFAGAEEAKEKQHKKRPSMSFFTALSLSLNNLMTKKTRTLLTSFAGSIGIIGIALVLSVSSGFQAYIDRVQEDTLTSYPITIQEQAVDLSSMLQTMADRKNENNAVGHELDAVYESPMLYELMSTMSKVDVNTNNLTAFKEFLDGSEEMKKYLSAYRYTYDFDFNIFTKNIDGEVVKSDVSKLFSAFPMGSSSPFMASSLNIWEEMLAGEGEMINQTVKEQYEVIAGGWPENYNDIVLVVNERNELSDVVLYALGLKTEEEMNEIIKQATSGDETQHTASKWSYEEIMKMSFKLILNSEFYQKSGESYNDLSQTEDGLKLLYESGSVGTELHVCGIIRSSKNAVSSMMSGAIGYTKALADYAIEKTGDSAIIKAQLADSTKDVISGLPFNTDNSEKGKAEAFRTYAAALNEADRAALYAEILSQPTDEYLEAAAQQQLQTLDRAAMEALIIKAYAESIGASDTAEVEKYIKAMSDDDLYAAALKGVKEAVAEQYKTTMKQQLLKLTAEQLQGTMEKNAYTDAQYAEFFDTYASGACSKLTYDEVLDKLGYTSKDKPSGVMLYATSFEDKDEIARIISEYNDGAQEADKINYTDYVALLMSSVTTIINAITYVLMAFVAISLVVSSIMIGIITYISVLERTKEIGLLRAVGASKRDVARVFNAETIIVGLTAGLLGIGISLLLLIPINLLLHSLTGIEILSAVLPAVGAAVLVAISIVLTFIAGLVPSGLAAKKNPVEALRTE